MRSNNYQLSCSPGITFSWTSSVPLHRGVNGGAVSDDDIFHVAQRWDRLGRPDHIVTVSENSNLSSGDSTAEGSSNLTDNEIWGVVSGVIALISILVGLAHQFGFVR